MKISRRDFIGIGVKSLLTGVIIYGSIPTLLRGFILPETVQGAGQNEPVYGKYDWRFIIDIRKCIGCGQCVKACKLENDVPLQPEYNRTWVERYVITETGQVFVDSPNAGIDGFADRQVNTKYNNLDIMKSFFVPKLCNQCDEPPCVRVCPVGATYKTKEGVVLVNRNACIGCRYCIQACPYGARFLDPRLKVVDKCTWCYHRITRGLIPVCMEVCPTGARVFGSVSDTDGLVKKLIREETMAILKPDVGCKPKVYYIGLEKGVQ